MLPLDRDSIDATSRGALIDKTPSEARKLVFRVPENSQNVSCRTLDSNSSSSSNNSIKEVNLLTKIFASFVKGEVPKVASCGVYSLLQ